MYIYIYIHTYIYTHKPIICAGRTNVALSEVAALRGGGTDIVCEVRTDTTDRDISADDISVESERRGSPGSASHDTCVCVVLCVYI